MLLIHEKSPDHVCDRGRKKVRDLSLRVQAVLKTAESLANRSKGCGQHRRDIMYRR